MFAGQHVTTPYGKGIIKDVRENGAVVTPTSWRLAGGQAPQFFLHKKDISPLFNIGDHVKTAYGIGEIKSIRTSDGIHVVKLVNWKQAVGNTPELYIHGQSLEPIDKDSTNNSNNPTLNEHFCVNMLVNTPFGVGTIKEIRETGQLVVEPRNWQLATGRPPVFYLDPKVATPAIPAVINENVMSMEERAAADAMRDTAEKLYKEQNSIKNKILRAIELKDRGSDLFGTADYEGAKMSYTQALSILNVCMFICYVMIVSDVHL
jgi:hypothetical protein